MAGILFSSLKDHMTVKVMTLNSHYLIRKICPELSWMMGGTRKDGTARYENWTPIHIIGSAYPTAAIRPGYIGPAMQITFIDFMRGCTITTSVVRSISLIYPHCTFEI
jgi:hypothetical protein